MLALTVYFVLPLVDELAAHLLHHRNDDAVEEVVALYIKIGSVGGDAQLLERFLHVEVGLLGIWVLALQLSHARAYLTAHALQYLRCFLNGEMSRLDDAAEVADGEQLVDAHTVVPDAPDKEREDGLRVLAHELGHVEHLMVVERDGNAHLAQRRRVALQVFDGVGVSVEHVGILEHLARAFGGALHQIVVVGIDAGYHVRSRLPRQQLHHGSLLAALQLADARGEHDLEVALLILEATEHSAPEEHIVVGLHVGHDALPALLRLQPVGRLDV